MNQNHDALAGKKRQWITQELNLIGAEMGYSPNSDEIQQIVELTMQFMDEQQAQGNIVVNEAMLRHALNAQQGGQNEPCI